MTTPLSQLANNAGLSDEEFLLVRRLAKLLQYRSPVDGLLDDLIQEGILGLFDAKLKYQAKDDCSFRTYATIRIKGAMLDFLRNEDHVSRSVREKVQKLKKASNKLRHELSSAPTLGQLSEELHMDIDTIAKLLSTGGQTISLEDANETAIESLCLERSQSHEPYQSNWESDETSDQLAAHLQKLSVRERQIIKWRYEDEQSFPEIAKKLKVSTSMCAQLHRNSLKKLGQMMGDNKPRL